MLPTQIRFYKLIMLTELGKDSLSHANIWNCIIDEAELL